MKHNYDIKVNPPKLSDKDIGQHKDFDKLLENFSKKNKTPRKTTLKQMFIVGASLAAAASLAMLIFFQTNDNSTDASIIPAPTFVNEKPYINPPLEALKPAFSNKTLNINSSPSTLYQSIEVAVPPNSLKDNKGNFVEGQITIRFRQIQNYREVFQAGYPVYLKDKNTFATIPTQEIIEIYAEQNGQPLQIAEGQFVELLRQPDLPQIDGESLYFFDEEKGTWLLSSVASKKKINRPAPSSTSSPSDNILEETLAAIEAKYPLPLAPTAPKSRDESKAIFDNFVAVEQHPTLAHLRGKMFGWQLSNASEEGKLKSAQSISWKSLEVKKRPSSEETYELIFINNNKSLTFLAHPVLIGPDYKEAYDAYKEQKLAYEQNLSAIKSKIDAEKEVAIKDFNANKNKIDSLNQESKSVAINTFKITSFGLWSIGSPKPIPSTQAKVWLQDDNGNSLDNTRLYLADLTSKSLTHFEVSNYATLSYEPSHQNMVWLVTAEQKIAYLKPLDFKKALDSNAEKQLLTLTVTASPIQSTRDLEAIFKMEN